MATGGSTNAVLHYIAMARSAGVKLKLGGLPAHQRSGEAAAAAGVDALPWFWVWAALKDSVLGVGVGGWVCVELLLCAVVAVC